MTGAFRLPLLGIRVPLAPAGVRILAAISLLATAGLVASLVAGAPPAGREQLVAPVALALSALALIATVPSLLDGELRFPIAGIASLCLGLTAAAATGLGASPLAAAAGWLVVVVGAATGIYHLLGADASPDHARTDR